MVEILIVDDDAICRHVLRAALERERCTVLESDSTDTALALLQGQGVPAMAIIDLHLGAESGLGLVARLREDPFFAPLPVLLISASPDRASVAEAARWGALGFLARPPEPARLRAYLQRARQHDWREAHFEPAPSVCRRLHTDRDHYDELARKLLAGVRCLRAGLPEHEAERAALLAMARSLCLQASELGFRTLHAALDGWIKVDGRVPWPPLVASSPMLERIFFCGGS